MLRILKELFKKIKGDLQQEMGILHEDEVRHSPKGEVFFELRDAVTGVLLETRHINNIVTKDLSILIARLLKSSQEPQYGIRALAVGTGEPGWDLMNPPAPTSTQRALSNELIRKTFVNTYFRDEDGGVSPIPTNVVDFTTTFGPSEAVGPLVEMGLLGGDISGDLSEKDPIIPASGPYDPLVDVVGKDTLCNYLTFPVINKPSSATLTLTWRITL